MKTGTIQTVFAKTDTTKERNVIRKFQGIRTFICQFFRSYRSGGSKVYVFFDQPTQPQRA